jgi:aminoglycoside phosphotransferase (APT) family kinase protein
VDVHSVSPLNGGFSRGTVLVDTNDGWLAMRFGVASAHVEAAVMRLASGVVPVPDVRLARDGCLVTEYVPGVVLQEALAADVDLAGLGQAVGESLSRIGTIEFSTPGFFHDDALNVEHLPAPWSVLLTQVTTDCMLDQDRLNADEQRRWLRLCERAAPELSAVDHQAFLVHADANPKNVIVRRVGGSWQVGAWIDWEFAHAGCPFADAANMLRFAEDYPPDFVAGFLQGYGADRSDWLDIGRAFDLFSLCQLLSKPVGHPIGDRVEVLVRQMLDV